MFKDQTVVITGASSGIGEAIATAFLSVGANIVINARNKKGLEEFQNQHN